MKSIATLIASATLYGCSTVQMSPVRERPVLSANEIIGKSWEIRRFNGISVPRLLVIRFESSTVLSGAAVCNSFGGTYTLANGRIVPGLITETALGCEIKGNVDARNSIRRLFAQPAIPAQLSAEGLVLYEERNRLVLVPGS